MIDFVPIRLKSAHKIAGTQNRSLLFELQSEPIFSHTFVSEHGISPATYIPCSLAFMDQCLNIVTFLSPTMGFDLIVNTHSPKLISAALFTQQVIQQLAEDNIPRSTAYAACELKTSTAFANENNFVNQPAVVGFKVPPQGGFRTFIVSIPYQNVLSYSTNTIKSGINTQPKTSIMLEAGLNMPERLPPAYSGDPEDILSFAKEFNLPIIPRLFNDGATPAFKTLIHPVMNSPVKFSPQLAGVGNHKQSSALTIPVYGRQVPGTWLISSYTSEDAVVREASIMYKPLAETLF